MTGHDWRFDTHLRRAALALVGLFLVWSLVEARPIIATLYLNGDNASALTLAQFADERGDGNLVLGNYAWLEPLFALHWTKWVPYHRQFWEVAPIIVQGAATLLLGWTILQAVGRRAAVAAMLAMAVPSPVVFGFVGVPNAHGHTLQHSVLLAAFLVTLPRVGAWRWPLRLAWAAALALTYAPAVASDVLVVAGAGAGFLVACAAAWWLRIVPRSVALLAAGACVAGILLGRVLVGLAEDAGVIAVDKTFLLANADQVVARARMLLEALALYVHGRFGGEIEVVRLVRTGLALAFALLVVVGVTKGTVPALRALRDSGRSDAARLLAVFWGVVLAGTAAAYVLTDAATDIFGARYTVAMWPALVTLPLVLAPVLATRAVTAVAVVSAAMGSVALAQGEYQNSATPFPQGRIVGDLQKFVEREGLHHGYGSYWDSATIMQQTDFKVRLYPVQACGDGRCPFVLHRIDAWYVPQPRPVRTFYVEDSAPLPTPAGPPPARWGKPAKVVTFGQLKVSVYNFDLAARLPEGT